MEKNSVHDGEDGAKKFEDFLAIWQEDVENLKELHKQGQILNLPKAQGVAFAKKMLQYIDEEIDLETEVDLGNVVVGENNKPGSIDLVCFKKTESVEETEKEDEVESECLILFTEFCELWASGEKEAMLREILNVLESLGKKDFSAIEAVSAKTQKRIIDLTEKTPNNKYLINILFLTERPLEEKDYKSILELNAYAKSIDSNISVDTKSVFTLFESSGQTSLSIPIKIDVLPSHDEMVVGTVKLLDLYLFLKQYKYSTQDLDTIYDKNIRFFLSKGSKFNNGIRKTLEKTPQYFGLYNNGITMVVESFKKIDNKNYNYELCRPYIVNGCQTTKTLWNIFYDLLDSKPRNEEIEKWIKLLDSSRVIIKIVRVGQNDASEELINNITRFTNSQNAINDTDFIALSQEFRKWKNEMEEKYGIYFQTHRGGWESRLAAQRLSGFKGKKLTSYVEAWELFRVYSAGWFGAPGSAYNSKKDHLPPEGKIYKAIIDGRDDAGDIPFGTEDLYAAYLLYTHTINYLTSLAVAKMGGKAKANTLDCVLFYALYVQLLRRTLNNLSGRTIPYSELSVIITDVILNRSEINDALTRMATEIINRYTKEDAPGSVYYEPYFIEKGIQYHFYFKYINLDQKPAQVLTSLLDSALMSITMIPELKRKFEELV